MADEPRTPDDAPEESVANKTDDEQPPAALDEGDGAQTGEPSEKKRKLHIEVEISDAGPCKKHIKVTIPTQDIDAQFDEAFSEMVESAAVPGFRPGHAPRKLIEKRYRKDVSEQVKAQLLAQSLEQLAENHELPILSQPDLDPEAVELPDEGPMVYEFDVEVRPEFELPDYKGIKIRRPVREIDDADVDRHLQRFLRQFGQLVPKDEPAQSGDFCTVDIVFRDGQRELSRDEEQQLQIRPVLRLRDGEIKDFDKLLGGATPGDTRTARMTVSPYAPNVELRGREIEAVFTVKDVKYVRLPDVDHDLLDRIGMDSEEELRDAVRASIRRRLEYEQHRTAREQVLQHFAASVNFELPEDLVRRQADRELSRRVIQMRRAGFSEQEIRARQNELRQNSLAASARSLKEHFVLARIAEQEKLDVTPDDIDMEIRALAFSSDESPRRVRARLEKQGLMDELAAEILEHKALLKVLEYADYEDVPYHEEPENAEALDFAAAGGDKPIIPEAESQPAAAQ